MSMFAGAAIEPLQIGVVIW